MLQVNKIHQIETIFSNVKNLLFALVNSGAVPVSFSENELKDFMCEFFVEQVKKEKIDYVSNEVADFTKDHGKKDVHLYNLRMYRSGFISSGQYNQNLSWISTNL